MPTDHVDVGVRLGVLEHRAEEAARVIHAIQESTDQISRSLASLVRLEEQHGETRRSLARAFEALAELQDRVVDLEREAPLTQLTRKWVIFAVTSLALSAGALAVVGFAVLRGGGG